MKNKYDWLTKEILEKDYSELGNFKLIAEKYKIPRSTVERYCKVFDVKTTPKISYEVDHNLFSTDTEESFYLAGFIAADGCINQHKCSEPNYIRICLSKKDEMFLIKLKNVLKFSGPIKYITRKLSKYNKTWNDSEQISIDIYSKQIIKDLQRFGIGPRKSLTYGFPEWLVDHPLAHHFMRGYSDGDGSFYTISENRNTKKYGMRIQNKMCFSIRGTNSFLLSFKNVLFNHGINTKSLPKFNNGIDQLRYSGNRQTKKVASFLYKNFSICMDRKYNLIKELIK